MRVQHCHPERTDFCPRVADQTGLDFDEVFRDGRDMTAAFVAPERIFEVDDELARLPRHEGSCRRDAVDTDDRWIIVIDPQRARTTDGIAWRIGFPVEDVPE